MYCPNCVSAHVEQLIVRTTARRGYCRACGYLWLEAVHTFVPAVDAPPPPPLSDRMRLFHLTGGGAPMPAGTER